MGSSSFALGGVSAAIVSGCLTFPALAADDATTIATGLVAKYEQVVASKDAAKLANLFTEDAVFQNPKGIFKGRTAIEHYRADGFKAGVEKESRWSAEGRRCNL